MSVTQLPNEFKPAVPAPQGSVDCGVAWHYGDPHREQRALADGTARVDLSHRGVLRVTGTDRLPWLNDLTTQLVKDLRPGASALALILDPHGHVEHELHLVDDGSATWISTEPRAAAHIARYLDSMRFLRDVTVADVSGDYAVIWAGSDTVDGDQLAWRVPPEYSGRGASDSGSDRGGNAAKYVTARPAVWDGVELLVPRPQIAATLSEAETPAGTWALEALRVAAAVPRAGFETDHKTLPHEVGWIGPAVHLAKGCYRGQETVARVHNLGRPPRRLTLLHLDGSVNVLPQHGDEVVLGERVVGFVGSAARHYELGPIATAVVKRSVPVDEPLVVRTSEGAAVPAAQQEVVIAG